MRKGKMALPVPKREELYTYGDYLTWPDEERWELIEGIPYDMSPAPFRRHQGIVIELARQIANFLIDKSCEVYAAPFDVRLMPSASPEQLRQADDDDITTVVQPDIAVICDRDKLDERGCLGAPDMVIEILSPSTAAKDQIQKLVVYEKSGVKEYWIVHPTDKIVTIRLLNEQGKYGIPSIHEGKGTLPVHTLPDLEIDLDRVFREQ
jgi:Uma2 family endonuclease